MQSELLNISKQDIEKKTDTIIKDIWNVPYEMIQTFSIAGDEFRVLCQNAKNYINYLENAIPVSSQEFCLVRIGFLQDGLAVYNAGTDIPISSVLEKSLEYSVGAQMVFDENGIRQFTIQNPYQIKKVKKRGAIISADKALENATKIITNEISLSANERVEIFHMNMEYILQDKDEQMVVVPYWVIAYKDAEDIFAVRINALTGENFAYGG